MNFFQYIPLVAALSNFVVTLLVVCRDPRPALNRIFALWGISLTVWNLGTFYMFRVTNQDDALFWARFLQYGVIFIPISLFHLSLLIAHIQPPKYFKWLYAVPIGLAVSNFFGYFITGVRSVGYAYYSVAGPGFWVFACTLSVTVASVVILLAKRRKLPLLHKKRLTPLIVAQGALVVLGSNDVMPIMGIDYYPFTGIKIYPIGSAAAVFYGIIVGYSVLQHQLLDVSVTLSRLAAHLVRLTFLFVIGLFLLLLASLFARNEFTPASFLCSLAVLLLSSVIASFFFPRLFGGGGETLERRLLGDRFEYHVKVRSFIASMQHYADNELMLNDLENLFVNTIGMASYQLIVLDQTNHSFSVSRFYPAGAGGDASDLHVDSPIFRYFGKSKSEYLALNIDYVSPVEGAAEHEAREDMKNFKGEFCLPLVADDTPFGLLLVGPKTNSEPYTATDINLLTTLVKSLNLLIHQARLKDQILLAQELDLLGSLSRGMAHDLNNLLTPLWTLLQLAGEGTPLEDLKDNLLPLATRNIETIRAYIKEALFFSRNLRPNIQLGRLDVVVSQAVEMMSEQFKRKNIEAVVKTAPDVLVEMDEVLIKRLIINLLSNALDASPPGSELRIELARLAKAQAKREWLRVSIIDRGEGIPEENLNRIFTPYYTTKDRGDENRGFGLGLSICRKIVHLHGGNLSVASKPKKGTTVNVDLPNSQSRVFAPNIIEVAK